MYCKLLHRHPQNTESRDNHHAHANKLPNMVVDRRLGTRNLINLVIEL